MKMTNEIAESCRRRDDYRVNLTTVQRVLET